jgi:N-acetyl-1-D-myo-inositol-2-amino-2-deoxy-alpha-D-glucopyranoside deacetylase
MVSNGKKVLLAVLAHPDDESFGMGGSLAYYAKQGVEVHLVCATRGEAGEVDPHFLEGFHSIAERRESELRCAAGILRLAGVYFLDYRDSGMAGSPDNDHPGCLAAAPLDEVTACVASYVRKLRPQVVITFDPIGGYKHPDHIAIQRATVKAFDLAGDENFKDSQPAFQPQKLYFHVFPKQILHFWINLQRLLGRDPRRFGRNNDIDLVSLVEDGDFPVHAHIDIRSVRKEKEAASACHASQVGGGPPRRGWMKIAALWWDRKEMYMRAVPVGDHHTHEKDLFEGVKLS